MRNYTYPRGTGHLARGVTFDTEDVGAADEDEGCREQNKIDEEGVKDVEFPDNYSDKNDVKEKLAINEDEKSIEEKVEDYPIPDLLLPPPRQGSLVSLQESRRGSLIAKFKSV